jgi:Kdo2-lipid IVA lauroyltransferase/acyltransferase
VSPEQGGMNKSMARPSPSAGISGFPVYVLVKGFGACVNLLSEHHALWLGRLMGRLFFSLDRHRRNLAIANLGIAFGRERSEEEIHAIAKSTFQNLGMTAVEFFRIPRLDETTFKRKVKVEGMEIAEELLRGGKGILLLLSHFGNWELMGMMSKLIGDPVVVIARPIKKNPWVNDMVAGVRKDAGLEVVFKEKASRKVFQALSRNRVVGILIDQRAKRGEGLWIDFFGKKAPTTPALAVLAMRTGAPVMPAFMVRDKLRPEEHHLLVLEPLPLVNTGEVKKDIEANTLLMNQVLERMIRRYPDQWFWVHSRWERKKWAPSAPPCHAESDELSFKKKNQAPEGKAF